MARKKNMAEKVSNKISKQRNINNQQKAKKLKDKKKQKVALIAPRLQLEPRLSPKQNKVKYSKNKEPSISFGRNKPEQKVSVENQNEPLKNVTFDGIKLPDKTNFDGQADKVLPSNASPVVEESKCKIEFDEKDYSDFEIPRSKHQKLNKTFRCNWWKERELYNLAFGLHSHGFYETNTIAKLINSRNENEVCDFIKRHSLEAQSELNRVQLQGKSKTKNCWSKVSPEYLPNWPNVRKWRRLLFEQMSTFVRMKDYSKPVLIALLQKCYEEEEEPSDPQIINVKLIYKYLLDCIRGVIPAVLPPKESALVLELLKNLRLLPIKYDFEEEKTFLRKYKEATRYKSFQVKDEFKKKFYKANSNELYGENYVAVPEDIFVNLSRHRRLVQSFSPLMIPMWLIQKQQELLDLS